MLGKQLFDVFSCTFATKINENLMKPIIAPSVLAANFLNLEKDIHMINSSDADYLHVDIMDGVFVPNISFGPSITKKIDTICSKPLDVHLMIVQPERYIKDFVNAGADILTVHYEACTHLHRTIQEIKLEGIKAGVSINPHTPVSVLENVIEDLDLVLIMSVNPGFGGQKFIPNSLNKLKQLRKLVDEKNPNCLIEVDGGVGLGNAKEVLDAGADMLVAGSAVFKSEDPSKTIHQLKHING